MNAEDTPLTQKKSRVVYLSYSGFWRRFAAFLGDVFCLFVIKIVAGFVIGLVLGGSFISVDFLSTNSFYVEERMSPVMQSSFISVFILGWVIHFTYFMVQYLSPHQATFGMRALSIKLVDEHDHGPVTFTHCFWRYFASFFSGLFLGIGYLMIIFTSRKQAFHDLLTNVCVVKTTKVIDNLKEGASTTSS